MQPAIVLFEELGWKTLRADDETYGLIGTLEYGKKSEVMLLISLQGALTKLDPTLSASSSSP